MQQAKTIASCGMMAALSVVIMLLGGVLGLGMYASPMIAGFCVMYIGREHGTKYQWIVWAAVSLLSLLLVPNAEENLMYICFFGLYPILHPQFEKLPMRLRWVCKLLYFNVTVIAVEMLVMLVLVPEAMAAWMLITLLLMGNVIFLCYDFLIPRSHLLFQKYFGRFMKR